MKRIFIAIAAVVLFSGHSAGVNDISANKASEEPDAAITRHFNLRKTQLAFNGSRETENIKTYKYDKNRIYKIPLREYIHTVVRLPENEKMKKRFVLGDTVNFHFSPIDNNTFEIWGEHPGADTSLTVLGKSGKIYSFYLSNYSVKSNQLPDLTVYITGNVEIADEIVSDYKPCLQEDKPEKQREKLSGDYLRELSRTDPAEHNYNYVIGRGNKRLKPLRVFDDGYFTYFQFAEDNLDSVELPEVYAVIDGYDTPVQTRVKNGFLIATMLNNKWTVRNGEKFLCVRKSAKK
jgi:type IV secretory pathway VirB9-like protein